MINVTKTYLPDFDKYVKTVKRAWDKSWITNNGELVQELEARLKQYLGVKHLFFCNNGTIVLQMALKVFNITGEVITTPFSYVATTNAILWEGCTPVFVDIDPKTFCIDAYKIEEAITDKTQAILATHVYGYPCNIEKIEAIAKENNLKVIYDGAHAFGCTYKGKSLLSYGDISTCSFHATKLFHTVEGGCVITNDDAIAEKLMLYRQFGHIGDDYYSIGINGKASEFHAAMGLCVLDDIDTIIADRKRATDLYNSELAGCPVKKPHYNDSRFVYNFSYYPVFFENEELLLKTKQILLDSGINARRYFFPSLNQLPFLKKCYCAISEDASARALCLPMFYGIEATDIHKIVELIKQSLRFR